MSPDLLTDQCLEDPAAGRAAWLRIADARIPGDLVQVLQSQFAVEAPRLADPDMALRNLSDFLVGARNPLSTSALFERDHEALPHLLQLLCTSQYLADLLVRDQECYDLIRMTEGQPVAREMLVEELVSEAVSLDDLAPVSAALRLAKQRETIRIAYGDIIRDQPVATVARQISFLADAIVEAALAFLLKQLDTKYGVPRRQNGERARFCVLALGKLGGVELNYSSDIDLIFLYDEEGQTDATRGISNREYFDRLSRDLIKLVGEATEQGQCYRVDLRLRPEGSQGPICDTLDSMLIYYDTKGRTWERQAYIKARPMAGEMSLGNELLKKLQPWIYRRYLSLADIVGIGSLKRRIERGASTGGDEHSNVKTGHGGIRDIEFVIQFLQLVNGGSNPEVRTGSTFEAIKRLEQTGCLTPQERTLLEENYDFLRKVEHRLQILFDLQTHTLPESDAELRKLAIRLGYSATPNCSALKSFQSDYRDRTEMNRRILDHLLHDAFGEDAASEPEVDLVNDPNPSDEQIAEVLGRYPFENVPAAYKNLMSLATEKIRFLSTRRCRHFLASIAPRLLSAIAVTPQPDATLVNLSRSSDSLGGKAALWELFSQDPPLLHLYVKLCASCPYLAEILTSNPGMIDELMDSLIVDRLPTLERLEESLAELTRGAEDLDPILHSFKHAHHLRVGVRDILGKDDIRETHASLANTAESCLRPIILQEYDTLAKKHGVPTIGELPENATNAMRKSLAGRVGEECSLVVLALGKLGGREPNYHSDLDLIFLYEADGQTVPQRRTRRDAATSNGHFFGELGQLIITVANRLGPYGRLYEVDAKLRPTGRNGILAMPIDALTDYFQAGGGQLWERQALCKARVIFGTAEAAQRARAVVSEVTYHPEWKAKQAAEIRDMRYRMEETASPRNLKRGRGGTVDIEFLVQMLQLQHGAGQPVIRATGTLDALDALETARLLSTDDTTFFSAAYRLLRNVEARIRLMNSAGRHEFPTEEVDQKKLAFLMGYPDPTDLEQEVSDTQAETRLRFDRLFDIAEKG